MLALPFGSSSKALSYSARPDCLAATSEAKRLDISRHPPTIAEHRTRSQTCIDADRHAERTYGSGVRVPPSALKPPPKESRPAPVARGRDAVEGTRITRAAREPFRPLYSTLAVRPLMVILKAELVAGASLPLLAESLKSLPAVLREQEKLARPFDTRAGFLLQANFAPRGPPLASSESESEILPLLSVLTRLPKVPSTATVTENRVPSSALRGGSREKTSLAAFPGVTAKGELAAGTSLPDLAGACSRAPPCQSCR